MRRLASHVGLRTTVRAPRNRDCQDRRILIATTARPRLWQIEPLPMGGLLPAPGPSITVGHPRTRSGLGSAQGWGQESDKQRAVEAGFDAHLTKPADPVAVMKILLMPRNAPAREISPPDLRLQERGQSTDN
jgi:hypothetical protein